MQQSRGHPLPRWDPRAPSPSPAGQHAARSPAVPAFPATAPGPRCAPPRARSGLPAAGPSGWRSPAAVEGKISRPSGGSESAHAAQGSTQLLSPKRWAQQHPRTSQVLGAHALHLQHCMQATLPGRYFLHHGSPLDQDLEPKAGSVTGLRSHKASGRAISSPAAVTVIKSFPPGPQHK